MTHPLSLFTHPFALTHPLSLFTHPFALTHHLSLFTHPFALTHPLSLFTQPFAWTLFSHLLVSSCGFRAANRFCRFILCTFCCRDNRSTLCVHHTNRSLMKQTYTHRLDIPKEIDLRLVHVSRSQSFLSIPMVDEDKCF